MPAPINSPASLPQKPATSNSRPQSSLRNIVKRSVSISDDEDQPTASTSTSTPVIKRGRYERKESSLVEKALKSISTQSPAVKPSSNKTQFEKQEDFISFDFEEDLPISSSKKGRGGNGSVPSGRKLDHYELKKEEHGKRIQRREKGRTTPWCESPGVNWKSCDQAIDMLNLETEAFITYISPTPIEHELRMWTVELIRRAIKSRYPDAEVECFGSVGTGLYLPGGDIDLVVLCPSFPSPPLKPTSSLLHSLASLLLNSSLAEPSSLLVIAKSRVPIVKFVTRYGGFSVDLSVNQKNGVDAALGVKKLLDSFSFGDGANKKGKGKRPSDEVEIDHGVARSLVLLVKAFLNQRGMNEVFTGGLGSYSIICLVVSFLQLHPKIQTGEIHPGKNIGLLLVEFLEYYGKHFNFEESGISLRKNGGYFNKHNKGWFKHNQPYLLSIEDPNDPTNDVSSGSHNIVRVRQTMAGAFEVLAATLCQRASAFTLEKSNFGFELSKVSLPTSNPEAEDSLTQSVLGCIIGISRAQIEDREANIDLFDQGVLQNLIEVGVSSLGGSNKAMKKLVKEERLKKTRAKTLLKLEIRAEERKQKTLNKAAKKLLLVQAIPDDEVEVIEPKQLFIRKEKVKSGNFEAEDSRYAPSSKKVVRDEDVITFDADSSDFSSEEDDDDVIVGGFGSDRIRNKTTSRSNSNQFVGSDSEEEEDDTFLRGLQDEEKRKTNLKKGKVEKQEKKLAYWSAKGPIEPSQ